MIRQRLRELYKIEPENPAVAGERDEEATSDYVRSVIHELEASRKALLTIQKRELDQIKEIIERVDKEVLYDE